MRLTRLQLLQLLLVAVVVLTQAGLFPALLTTFLLWLLFAVGNA